MRLNKEVAEVESLLVSDLVAKSPDENLTIFAIVNTFPSSDSYKNYEIAEVYWPEKEIAGYNSIYDYETLNFNINAMTANLINNMPRTRLLSEVYYNREYSRFCFRHPIKLPGII